MKKSVAILAVVLLILIVVVVTLGAINYAGIGDTLGGFFGNSIAAPIRNFFVDSWNFIGTSGWYILAAGIGLTLFGAFFWIPVVWNLGVQKGLKEKVLHKAPKQAPAFQSQPDVAIPISGLQNKPTPTPVKPTVKEEEAPV